MKNLFKILLFATMIAGFAACEKDESNNSDEPKVPENTLNGHEYVDLGLTSGVLWATCNVGADTPEQSGYHVAWGETEVKDYYEWSSYKYGKDWNLLTKYCNDSEFGENGFVDWKNMLDPEDDAATVHWGEGWRTPTREEIAELVNECTWEWVDSGLTSGYKISSKAAGNSNSIFLPASGSCIMADTYDIGVACAYWGAQTGDQGCNGAVCLVCDKTIIFPSVNLRWYGFAIRPVCFQ